MGHTMRGLFGEDLDPPHVGGGESNRLNKSKAVVTTEVSPRTPASVSPVMAVELLDWIDARCLEDLASLAMAEPSEKAAHAERLESIIKFLQTGLERFR